MFRIWQYTRLDINGVGGVETHVSRVSAALSRRGHEIHIGTEPPVGWRSRGSARVVVHTHGDSWPFRIPCRGSRQREGMRWIHFCHGTTAGRMIACREYASVSAWKGAFRDFLPTRFADAAIAVSETAEAEARRYFRMRLPASVIPNGADAGVFAPLKSVAAAPRVAFVGRGGDRVKNTRALLEACRRVHRRVPAFELVGIPGLGAGENFARDSGPLAAEQLAHELSGCRALVLCSFYEGDPIVLREAMAMGLPVIASDLAQLRAAMARYASVAWVDPRSVDSIAEAILNAVTAESLPRPSPILRAWDEVAREIEDFYVRIFEAKG